MSISLSIRFRLPPRNTICGDSSGSRIYQTGVGVPIPKMGAPTYYVANFFQKLYENERTWRMGHTSLVPPPLGSANLGKQECLQRVFCPSIKLR